MIGFKSRFNLRSRQWLILLFHFTTIALLSGQRLVTTNSGLKIAISSDGTWHLADNMTSDTLAQNAEIPYKQHMSASMIDDLRTIITHIEIKEILAFIRLDSLSKEAEHKKIKIVQAKKFKNKLEQRLAENELKALQKEIKIAENEYKAASGNTKDARSLKMLDQEAYIKKLDIIVKQHGIILSNTQEAIKDSVTESTVSEENSENKNKHSLQPGCKIVKDHTEGKNRTIETEKDMLFTYTPEKLKSYFKDKELMISEVAVIVDNNVTKLRLFQKMISKDASKNYGHIPVDALMRITLISGKKIDLYSSEASYGEVENYTGNVVYKTDFTVKDSDLRSLTQTPLDTIGLMWTSGFESYTIYNIDVLLKQLDCIKKIRK